MRRRRAAAAALLLGLATSCVPAAVDERPIAAPTASAQPKAEPLLLQPIAPEEAVAINASIPLADVANPPARPFELRGGSATDRMRSVECLTSAIYYEAASESDDGQRAVAQVVLNRVRHPTFPSTVCGVVYQGSERITGCQFSFTCDGSMLRRPSVAGWARARRIAVAALSGSVFAPVGHATHYHTNKVLPHWAPTLTKSAVVGAHIFYRWPDQWGTPAAFRQLHAGGEPVPGPKPRPMLVAEPVSTAAFEAQLAGVLKAAKEVEKRIVAAASKLAAEPVSTLPDPSQPPVRLPESQVREAYLNSGRPRDDVASGLPVR